MFRPLARSGGRREGKGLSHNGFLDLAATNALGANSPRDGAAPFLNPYFLQIRAELTPADSGGFAAVAT